MPRRRAPRRGSRGKGQRAHKDALSNGRDSGRSSRGDVSSRSGSKRTRKPRPTPKPIAAPYKPLEYLPVESLYFSNVSEWDPSRLIGGIKKISFGDSFDISDKQVDAIVAAGAALCDSLQEFRSGDSETGNGAWLTDTAVVNLAATCPNLIHVGLEASKGLTDTSLIAFFRNCPNIRYIAITGNDKNSGSVQGPALDELRENSDWGKKLERISVTDQCGDKKLLDSIESLSTSRKTLSILSGGTHDRDGSGVDTYIGGKRIDGFQAFGSTSFSQYGGPGGPFWFGGGW